MTSASNDHVTKLEANEMYEPIDTGRREIRVLLLWPGKVAADICCDLYKESLDDEPEYRALSYVWGDATKQELVTVNGTPHTVTSNLAVALRNIRHADEAIAIWIDALCINQQDIDEREQQVRIMGDIYQDCEEVLIWLGQETQSSSMPDGKSSVPVPCADDELLIPFRRRFGPNAVPTMRKDIANGFWGATHLIGDFHQDKHLDEMDWFAIGPDGLLTLRNSYPGILHALSAFMHQPWWSRTWVVQEAVLPKKATLLVNDFSGIRWSCSWDYLAKAAENCQRHIGNCCKRRYSELSYWQSDAFDDLYRRVSEIDIHRQSRADLSQNHSTGTQWTLDNLALTFSHLQATDPRDKIYAMLSLARASEYCLQITPDYRASAASVFSRAAVAMIKDANSLALLIRNPKQPPPDDLPSWVPAFTNPSEFKAIYAHRMRHARLYQASPESIQIELLPENALSLYGIEIDTVDTVSIPFDSNLEYDQDLWSQCAAISSVLIAPDEPYVAGGSSGEAFWRTLVADAWVCRPPFNGNGLDARRAVQSDHDAFTRWWASPKVRAHARQPEDEDAQMSVNAAMLDRRFMRTKKGFLGVGPMLTRPGDCIYVLTGARLPFVVRRFEEYAVDGQLEACFQLVGDCYVHGVMDGEASCQKDYRRLVLK